jgi:hypothetical protein
LVEANVSNKRAVSIFRAEVLTSGLTSALKMDTARLSETLASTNQSILRSNSKERHQNLTIVFLKSLEIFKPLKVTVSKDGS